MEEYLTYLPLVISGTAVTVNVAVLSLLLASILGMFGALARTSRSPILQKIAGSYTTLIRGVPDLVLLLLIFYGMQIGLNQITEALNIDYITIEPFTAGAITIGFIYGAYMTETFRGAIMAVEKGQIEAGHSFGFSNLQVFVRITLPQMVRHALAGFINNWLVLIKSTALISIIGLEDVIRKSSIAGGVTKKPFSFLMTAAFIYIILTSISLLVLKYVEKKYRIVD